MLFVLIAAACFYMIANLLIWIVLKRDKNPLAMKSTIKSGIKISIVVAAKNEGKNIANLIQSIYKNEYDQNDFEVIIVDDESSDNTLKILNESRTAFNSLIIISSENKSYPGKKGALTVGIGKSKYEYILITDADCIISKGWIKSFAKEFQNGYDFLFGVAPLKKGKGFINSLACFENLRSSILTFASAKLSLPYSAAARSFGFKKSSFEKLEGYSRTTETLSGDDDLLLRESVKSKMKIGCIIEQDAFVYSETKKSFKEYIFQKARHTKTSTHYLFKSQLMLALWHTINLLMLLSVFLIPVNTSYLYFFVAKLVIDLIVVISLQRKFGYSFSLIDMIILQPAYELMIVINFFTGMIFPDEWK